MTRHRSEQAAALIVVLWSVAIMGTLTMIFSSQSRLSLQVSDNLQNGFEAELNAEAGLYRAIGALVQDRELNGVDDLSEDWNNNATLFYDIPLNSGVYRVMHPDLEQVGQVQYGAMDESGKLNINVATREQLLQLPNMTEAIADAILDWRDEDEDPEPFGAEAEYYSQLDEPYLPANANFDTLAELLLVREITVELLYGEDVNTNGLLEVNENDGAETFPIDNADDEINLGWYPYLTCYSFSPDVDAEGNPRTNLNDAEEATIEETLGDVLDENTIERIIEARDDEAFESLNDLLEREVSTDDNEGGGGGRGGGGGGNQQNVLTREQLTQIIDRITISGEDALPGRVNLNTAPRQVLLCLFEGNEEIVEQVLDQRESDEGAFTDLGGVLELEGMEDEVLETVLNQATTKSNVFSIRALGYIESQNTLKEVYAIVDRGPDPPEIRYWKRKR